MSKINNILNMPMNKFKELVDSVFNRGITDKLTYQDENTELQKSFNLFGITIKNILNNNKIGSKELNSTFDMIAKANYDIDKLPTSTKTILSKTYTDLKNVLETDKVKYSNTFVETYVDIYETLSTNEYKSFVKNFEKDSKSMSGESIDMRNMNYLSNEGLFDKIFGKVNVDVPVNINIPGPTNTVIMICTITISCFIVALLLYSIIYMKKKTEGLDNNMHAVNSVEDDTVNNVGKYVMKPMNISLKFIKKMISDKKFSTKKLFSKESLEVNTLFSKEAFSQSCETFYIYTAVVLAGLILLIPAIRSFVYYISHLKLKLGMYFEEQNEIILFNINEIREKLETATDPIEIERLNKIIVKQSKASERFYNYSKNLLNECIKATYQVEDRMESDENVYWDNLEKQKENNKLLNNKPSGGTTVVPLI